MSISENGLRHMLVCLRIEPVLTAWEVATILNKRAMKCQLRFCLLWELPTYYKQGVSAYYNVIIAVMTDNVIDHLNQKNFSPTLLMH